MSSRFYGSIGFSEGLSIQARKTKEAALERLENRGVTGKVIVAPWGGAE